jgi:hypothetical protein
MNGVRVVRSSIVACCLLPLALSHDVRQPDVPLGVGFVSPRSDELQTLRFYGAPEPDQLADMVTPIDSVTFMHGEHHVDIATAPPYLVPEVLKLDYGMLNFRAVTLQRNWIEIVVNQRTGQTTWVDRHSVNFVHWSDFLINVFAVEVNDPASNPMRLKPLDHTGVVAQADGPLRGIAVRGDWLQVSKTVFDADGPSGWIRWRDGDRLLISYSILS